MNDRFRFRVWDKENKKFLKDNDFYFNYKLLLFTRFTHLMDDRDFIIQQCTGLKDNKGELIFEGDLVSFNCQNKKIFNMEVKWDSEEATFILSELEVKDYKGINFTNEISNYCEIIGNIFEGVKDERT